MRDERTTGIPGPRPSTGPHDGERPDGTSAGDTPPGDTPPGDTPPGGATPGGATPSETAGSHGVSRRRVVVGGVLAAAVAGGVSAVTDSVGVNLHMSYGDTPYAEVDRVRAALRRCGVRHVRDGWDRDRDDVVDAYRQLVADGVRLDLIVGTPGPGEGFSTELRRQLEGLSSALPDGVRSLEGPNEYDLSDDPDWVVNLRSYHHALADLVDDGVAGEDYDLVAPSFVHGDSREEVGPLPADFGNLHSYTGGDQPKTSHLDSELALAAHVAPGRRAMVTETGYNTAVANVDGQPGVPEDVAGTYVPRQFLENFRRGVVRTFTYELLDEHPDEDLSVSESNYGLLRRDFSEKPSFTALTRLMSLLDDEPGEHETRDLAYSVETSAEAPLRRLLVQKSTGEYYLAFWLEAAVWNQDEGVEVDPVSADVRVRLPEGWSASTVHRLSDDTPDVVSGRDVGLTATPAVQLLRVDRV